MSIIHKKEIMHVPNGEKEKMHGDAAQKKTPYDLLFEHETVRGKYRIATKAAPEYIKGLKPAEGMGIFSGPGYPADREIKALVELSARESSNVIVAVSDREEMIGFIAISSPSRFERWGELSDKGVLEALAIQVSRGWRGLGVAKEMMNAIKGYESFEDAIIICTGFSWHWDLAQTGLTTVKYRNMLLSFLEKAGFHYYETDEPNVNLDPSNFLTARVGKNVPADQYSHFERLLFKDRSWAEFKGNPRSIREIIDKSIGRQT